MSRLTLLLLLGCDPDDTGAVDAVESAGGWWEIDGLGVVGWRPSGEAYLCGDADNTDASRWLTGTDTLTSSDDTVALTLEGSSVTLVIGPDTHTGTLTAFEDGGLYHGFPEDCRSGAILYGGTLSGVWCDGVVFRQVEPIDTLTGGPPTIEAVLIDDDSYTFTLERLP